jgi:hypothetical protein
LQVRHDQRQKVLSPDPPTNWHEVNRNSIQFRATGLLGAILLNRAARRDGKSLTQTAKRDLARYYALIRMGLARFDLTEAEAACLIEAIPLDAEYGNPEFLAVIESRCRAGMADEWGVDTDALLAKLGVVSAIEEWAILDAARHWWQGAWDNTRQGLVAVGLLREPGS